MKIAIALLRSRKIRTIHTSVGIPERNGDCRVKFFFYVTPPPIASSLRRQRSQQVARQHPGNFRDYFPPAIQAFDANSRSNDRYELYSSQEALAPRALMNT